MAWPRDGFADSAGRDAQRMGTSCGARGAGRATPRYLLKVCLRACVDRDVFDSALGAWGRGAVEVCGHVSLPTRRQWPARRGHQQWRVILLASLMDAPERIGRPDSLGYRPTAQANGR